MFTRYVQTIRLDSCVTPLPLSRRLWRKLSGHKLESTTENFHKNFTFKKFTFHHMKVSEWLKMYSISQSYISPPIIVSKFDVLLDFRSRGPRLNHNSALSGRPLINFYRTQYFWVSVSRIGGKLLREFLVWMFGWFGFLIGLKACRRKGENFVCWLNFRAGRGGLEMIYSMFQCLKENWNCILDIKK